MSYRVVLVLALSVVWISWSGHLESFLIALGILSVAGVAWLAGRMGIVDAEGIPTRVLGIRWVLYVGWLVKEIVRSNLDVARRILQPSMPINPGLIRIRSTQASDLGRVILANSITLTPGTVTVEVQGPDLLVHALVGEAAQADLEANMDPRVTELEKRD